MLRSAGIPTRYVDGYLASDFYAKNDNYVCGVLDSNAHAWIEVYVSGYGWMTFEMTEPMLSDLYYAPGQVIPETETETETEAADTETESATETVDPPVTHKLPYIETDESVPPNAEENVLPETLMTLGIVLLCVLILSSPIFFKIKISEKAKKRDRMLSRALKGESTDPAGDINEISRYIFFLFGLLGLKRDKSELMKDFVKRADRITCGTSFAAAAEAIQKNAFGRCADAKDCADAAKFAVSFQRIVLALLSRPKKFLYYKVLKKI